MKPNISVNLPRMYVVGSLARAEFADARRWFRRHTSSKYLASLPDALRELRQSQRDPDAVVVVQAHSGQHNHRAVLRLLQSAPLTRFILLYGSWCEGETRSGTPLPIGQRVAWYRFVDQMSAAFRPGAPIIAATAADDERWRQQLKAALPDQRLSVGVAYAAHQHAEAQLATLRASGHLATRFEATPTAREFDVILWDDAGANRQPRTSLEDLARAAHHTPILALLTFPRTQDVRAAKAAGAAAVLAKPFQVADLLRQLSQLAGGKSKPRSSTAA